MDLNMSLRIAPDRILMDSSRVEEVALRFQPEHCCLVHRFDKLPRCCFVGCPFLRTDDVYTFLFRDLSLSLVCRVKLFRCRSGVFPRSPNFKSFRHYLPNIHRRAFIAVMLFRKLNISGFCREILVLLPMSQEKNGAKFS